MQSYDGNTRAANTRTRARPEEKEKSSCGAKTRNGHPCRTPAMPNGRCRMHGGTNPGAPRGNQNAFKHGMRSAEQLAWRRLLRAMKVSLA
jgi:uncharacterized protein YjcR